MPRSVIHWARDPKSTAPGLYALRGFRLPYSARRSGRLDEEFPLVGRLTGDAGGDWSYVGEPRTAAVSASVEF
jgi:hypothetical protein